MCGDHSMHGRHSNITIPFVSPCWGSSVPEHYRKTKTPHENEPVRGVVGCCCVRATSSRARFARAFRRRLLYRFRSPAFGRGAPFDKAPPVTFRLGDGLRLPRLAHGFPARLPALPRRRELVIYLRTSSPREPSHAPKARRVHMVRRPVPRGRSRGRALLVTPPSRFLVAQRGIRRRASMHPAWPGYFPAWKGRRRRNKTNRLATNAPLESCTGFSPTLRGTLGCHVPSSRAAHDAFIRVALSLSGRLSCWRIKARFSLAAGRTVHVRVNVPSVALGKGTKETVLSFSARRCTGRGREAVANPTACLLCLCPIGGNPPRPAPA